VLSLVIADPPGGGFSSFTQVRRAVLGIVGVARQNVNISLIEHTLRPI
jgi:hypothetical protein